MQVLIFLIVLVVLHIIVSAILFILIKADILKVSSQAFMLELLLPFWGLLMIISSEIMSRSGKNGIKKEETYQFLLDDEDYHKAQLSHENDVIAVVPVEEAILINDSKTRREFMMDIIGEHPEGYIELLQKARFSDDIEVAHYASTAIMEIQRDYEMKIMQAKELFSQEEENVELLDNYILSLKNYIASGLIEESVLQIQRKRYHEMLTKRMAMDDASPQIFYDAIDNQIELGNAQKANEVLSVTMQKWPNLEETWFLEIKLAFLQNDGEKIHIVIERLKDTQIFLTTETRQLIAFWSGQKLEEMEE